MIICGSSASWILDNIINNKGGLHNRITKRLHLEPLNLPETKHFLKARGVSLTNRQITELYMAIGGIPYYLDQVKSGLSSTQIIEQLVFSRNGFLLTEFDRLFSSLLKMPEYMKR